MISGKVTSEKELQAQLTAQGFEVTSENTATGVYWRHNATGCHILVPYSVQGFYPTWLTEDMTEQIDRLCKMN